MFKQISYLFRAINLKTIEQTLMDRIEQKFIYSVPIGEKKPGQSRIHRHPKSADGLLMPGNDINSLADIWDQAVKHFPNHKIAEHITYSQADKLARSVGSWFTKNNHKRVYLFSKNCPEWTLTDIAAWNYGLDPIPLYSTLGQQALQHILKLTEGRVVASTSSMVEVMLKSFVKERGKLTTVLMFDQITEEQQKKLTDMKFEVIKFSDIVNQQLVPRPELTLDSHMGFLFTSGTTGVPKGVIYTHLMVITQIMAMEGHFQLNDKDVHLSYLPIAHAFERFMTWYCIYRGSNIQYAKFPVTQILKDLQAIKPTILPIVPRLINKLYSPMKAIFDKENSAAKIKGAFGGRIRIMVTGSAPVAAEFLHFFRNALQCDLREGYGQTQTTAGTFITCQGDSNYGHVGGVIRAVEFKLVDVPEMHYFSDDKEPKGQVCVRGGPIFKGYYKDQDHTKEALDSELWNHTGDIGIILPNGSLKLIDRKKNIYKLSQGEYIAPEKIENVYIRCPYVAQAFVYGDSMKDYNVAVVFPDMAALPKIAENLKIQEQDPQKLCENEQVVNFILEAMNKRGRDDGLNGFELARKLKISSKSFMTFGIFTSTLKLQRAVAKKVFISDINKMYENN